MLPRTPEPEVMDSAQEAAEYDRMDHSTVNQLFVDDLLTVMRAAPVPARQTEQWQILDLGTGTVQIPIRLLHAWPECGPVMACDLSVEMLRVGMQNLRQASLCDRILPMYCDAKRLPVADASVDVIISNSIIHHIPEPLYIFNEVRRSIRPGGLVFFRDLLRPESEHQIEYLVLQWAGHENEHAQRMFRESLHAALTLDEVRQMLNQVGFDGNCVKQTSDRHWTLSLWT